MRILVTSSSQVLVIMAIWAAFHFFVVVSLLNDQTLNQAANSFDCREALVARLLRRVVWCPIFGRHLGGRLLPS
jgi:hypothetical protein